ncbi:MULTISPECIES: 5-formyltetrahydrofolate cyclo-ligase [unclassified Rhizobacter]|uniref:5-formyltetrahydrofolate cyclo-ligase n=1 Tax=unclassified Rhizobacter TaxID=2640088 RepID=UPI0006F6967B|nr:MULTISPECIES: 5-formyltetrahydrofolate cyclo-ligase [unclassified Rhizobacter]KQU67853.1 5-formyltetrahydrofolate cyclo-ligase [Rhizobacter sp. Root29]KQW15260.1 5-formyltetrahydrofolate cyclo-ligase [Rhizobacter sp. Root1238]KRB24424.1 5-formyltetrahydrofolate cyclo-ligase [Rhizobacter sp. Root16D2]
MATPDTSSTIAVLRKKLIADRQALPDRLELAVQLQSMLRIWLVSRRESLIGGYWPIKGEFDPLPALFRWSEGGPGRRIGLPVMDRTDGTLRFHVWYPGCPTELDAHDIPKPKGTEQFQPELLLLPCVGYGTEGARLGYGGGFYDRSVAALTPRPVTVGLCYAHGFLPMLRPKEGDHPLDAVITEEGVMWQRES